MKTNSPEEKIIKITADGQEGKIVKMNDTMELGNDFSEIIETLRTDGADEFAYPNKLGSIDSMDLW